MKNNIIKDDREISMKVASLATDTTDTSDRVESSAIVSDSVQEASDPAITSPLENHNLPTETCEMNTETLTDTPELSEPMAISTEQIAAEPIAEPAVALPSTQTEVTAFLENAKSTATELFNNNRQLFITLGWIVLAVFGAKVVFATLGIIDDIPLVTPIIKLVGLVSVVRFTWRYLIREHDRQELLEIIDRTKVEVLGDRQSLS
jgi:hypothetical protein